jgi:hypothetical protein
MASKEGEEMKDPFGIIEDARTIRNKFDGQRILTTVNRDENSSSQSVNY